jgi:membrane protein
MTIAAGLALYAALSDHWLPRRIPIQRAGDGSRGRLAEEPRQITLAGWYEILARVFTDIGRDNVSLMAAGIAFYALLSLAPALTALVALYGLAFEPSQVEAQVKAVEGLIPAEGADTIADQR